MAAGLAGVVLTGPGRREPLTRCLASLAPCVDRVYVGFAGALSLPPLPPNVRLVPLPEGERPDETLNRFLAEVEEPWTLRLDDDEWLDENPRRDLDGLVASGVSDAYALLRVEHRRDPADPEREAPRFSYAARLGRTGTGPASDLPRSQIALHCEEGRDRSGVFEPLDLPRRDEEARGVFLLQAAERAETLLGDPSDVLADAVARLLTLAVERAVRLPDAFAGAVERTYHGRTAVHWALGRYLQNLGDREGAVRQFQHLLWQSATEGTDFSAETDPRVLGVRLYETLGTVERYRRLLDWANVLRPPTPSPLFTTARRGDRLWIERAAFERLARGATERGFRPLAYPPELAQAIAEREGTNPGDFDWWGAANLPLADWEARNFARRLDAWSDALPDDPIPLRTLSPKPPYRVFGPASRLRRTAWELAEWLRSGDVRLCDYGGDLRYVALERSRSGSFPDVPATGGIRDAEGNLLGLAYGTVYRTPPIRPPA